MRKILLATPLRGGLPARYVQTLIQTLTLGIEDCTFLPVWVENEPVNFARNSLAAHALKEQMDELIFWDADLKPTPEDFRRLCSYKDAAFISAPYPSRNRASLLHVQYTGNGAMAGSLRQADLCSIGFCKINLAVFRAIQRTSPETACIIHGTGADPVKINNFFPMQVFGPNTAEGKLERLNTAFSKKPAVDTEEVRIWEFHEAAEAILNDPDYSASRLYGEDYGFCLLARKAGIRLMVDTGMLIRHTGEVDFPLEKS